MCANSKGRTNQLEVQVANLQQKIAERFLAKLRVKGVESERIDQLRILLMDSKKLKTDDLVKVFSRAGGDLK